jgi:hypothetical protein
MSDYCPCVNPSTFMRDNVWTCATCRKPLRGAEDFRPVPAKRATIPPEKAAALREIHNLRREFNAKLDRLQAEVLKA